MRRDAEFAREAPQQLESADTGEGGEFGESDLTIGRGADTLDGARYERRRSRGTELSSAVAVQEANHGAQQVLFALETICLRLRETLK